MSRDLETAHTLLARRRPRIAVRSLLGALAACLACGPLAWAQAPASAAAQAPASAPDAVEMIETAPIQCWWKTATTAVRIGERFTLTLTCGVIETRDLVVTAATNQLDPGAVQITPFEVVSGVRHADVVAPPRRYFQYEYQVRLLSEGFFGQDVSIPSMPVSYAIQAGSGAQGRDRSYILPALPLRVMTLVPQGASDIRDTPPEGFAPIETRRFRATSATTAAVILFGFAGTLLVLAGLNGMGEVRRRTPAARRPLAPLSVLGACVGTLDEVKTAAARDGWSPELARQALASLRVAGAVALRRPMAQTPAESGAKAREGQVVVRQGLVRPRRAFVSAAVTSHAIARVLASDAAPSGSRTVLEPLRGALQVFSTAAYGRTSDVNGLAISLDEALAGGSGAVRLLRRRNVWPFRQARSVRATVAAVRVPSLSEERL